ncbi:hypothetical protein Q5P01_005806 [Channa striata]|uniref:Uncharacterized protein n=1 Tax=Channa striata TaxID=64152 RepID=A0AA88NJY6_CHASR|nr:hypothetical protein Q5P01_005806 [Channa striata]
MSSIHSRGGPAHPKGLAETPADRADGIFQRALVDTWACGRRKRDELEDRDGSVDEQRCYQSQAAPLISSRPRCLLTLNGTPVGPTASLRWQHGRPLLLKCKSGFNLKQSRPAEIIFLPSSQVLPSLLPLLSLPPIPSLLFLAFPPSFPPPRSSSSLTPGVPELERASSEEATDKGKGRVLQSTEHREASSRQGILTSKPIEL